jgi:hypothetical protein
MDFSNSRSTSAHKAGSNGGDVAELVGAEPGSPNRDMTSDRVATFVRGATAQSAREIDALIRDLEGLRQKLVIDSNQLEQDLVEFTALNQSVINLTKIISDSVTRAKEPNAAS